MLEDIFKQVLSQVGPKVIVLLILMVADILLGVIVALVNKIFSWERFSSYLTKSVSLIFGWILMAILAFIPVDYFPTLENVFAGAVTISFAGVVLYFVSGLLDKFKSLGLIAGTMGNVIAMAGFPALKTPNDKDKEIEKKLKG